MKLTTITISLAVAVLSTLPVGCVHVQRQNVAAASELCHMPKAPLQTRWLTGENPQGIKGGAGKTRFGQKRRTCSGHPRRRTTGTGGYSGKREYPEDLVYNNQLYSTGANSGGTSGIEDRNVLGWCKDAGSTGPSG